MTRSSPSAPASSHVGAPSVLRSPCPQAFTAPSPFGLVCALLRPRSPHARAGDPGSSANPSSPSALCWLGSKPLLARNALPAVHRCAHAVRHADFLPQFTPLTWLQLHEPPDFSTLRCVGRPCHCFAAAPSRQDPAARTAHRGDASTVGRARSSTLAATLSRNTPSTPLAPASTASQHISTPAVTPSRITPLTPPVLALSHHTSPRQHVSSHAVAHYTAAAPHRIASHRNAPHRIASHRLATHRVASQRTASHHNASQRNASHRIASPRNAPRRVAAHR
jgi:hypothetical protein